MISRETVARIVRLESALKDARAWALHWDEDRKCNLPITAESVQTCLASIDRALAAEAAENSFTQAAE